MHPRVAVFFWSFATMKTVDDHCGFILPANPFQMLFQNNAREFPLTQIRMAKLMTATRGNELCVRVHV